MSSEPVGPPELLTSGHIVANFDCGKPALNTFLWHHALQNQGGGSSRTYVIARNREVVGYYSLAPGSVDQESAPDRVRKGQSRHPIPVILLARLALDQSVHGQGLGKHLLLDAFRRAVAGAEVIGGRALIVHAKDADAKAFYERFDMEPSPTNPSDLFLLIKDLRKALQP
jgi:GNAT superfamily N-acetyltransferase